MSTFSRWLLTLALAFCPLFSLSAEPAKDRSGKNRGPLVTGISPTKGKIGQFVTVRGKGLAKTTKVESQPVAYSGILNARFRVVSDEELRVMVTPNVGAVVLRIHTPAGMAVTVPKSARRVTIDGLSEGEKNAFILVEDGGVYRAESRRGQIFALPGAAIISTRNVGAIYVKNGASIDMNLVWSGAVVFYEPDAIIKKPKQRKEGFRRRQHPADRLIKVASINLCPVDSLVTRVADAGPVPTFHPHAGAVSQVTFSADGRRLLSAGTDGTVAVTDVGTGQLVRRIKGLEGRVHAGAFSLDARRFAVPVGKTVQVWDLAKQVKISTSKGHDRPVRVVAFSPSGERYITGGVDGTVRLWNVRTGAQIRVFKGHESQVISVAFAGDEKRAASADVTGKLILWNLESGKGSRHVRHLEEVFIGTPDEVAITCLRFAPDGRHLVAGLAVGCIELWNLEKDKPTLWIRAYYKQVTALAFSPEGKILATGGLTGGIKMWDFETIVESSDKRLKETERKRKEAQRANPRDWRRLVRNLDRANSRRVSPDPYLIRLYNRLQTGTLSITFAPDGQRVVIGSRDKTMKLLSVRPEDDKP